MSPETAATTTKRTTPAFVWGYNNRGALGLGHTARVYAPTPTMLPKGTVDVQGGVNFTVALTDTGHLYAWGGNQYGQLGDGTTTMRWEPTPITLPKRARVTAIAVGTDHVLARTSGGDVLAWGRNHRGQVGNGGTSDQHTPVVVRAGGVTSVAAGNGVSAAVSHRGDAYLWGRNTYAQLGLGTRDPSTDSLAQTRPTKALLPKGADAVAVDAGNRHVVVATTDGRLVTFGLDASGRPSEQPTSLRSSWGRPVQVCAGEDFTLVLTSRHTLLAIGGNASGQLGVGDTANRLTPAVVALPHATGHITDIWAGSRNAAALTSTGEVYTWGDGSSGQTGRGPSPKELALHSTPRRLTALDGARITAVSGGAHHMVLTATHGPAVALRMTPAHTSVAPDEPVTYAVHRVDVFGTDLGPADKVAITITDGHVVGTTARAHTPGVHHVTARADRLVGTAILTVQNGHHS